tara:strand:- start:16 stop:576 length:561 start_codon:yes stop_codon:yes gene_type:complete
MYRNILEWPNKKLRVVSRPVENFDGISNLIQDLIDTLNVAGGIGLAAPQIGVNKRVFVVRDSIISGDVISPSELNDKFSVFINPVVEVSGEARRCDEACLSFPHISARVPRFPNVFIKWQDETGAHREMELEGYLAQVIQHENDHLDGEVYLNKLKRTSKAMLLEKMRKKRKKEAREKKRALRALR